MDIVLAFKTMSRNSKQSTEMPQAKSVVVTPAPAVTTPVPTVSASTDASVKRVRRTKPAEGEAVATSVPAAAPTSVVVEAAAAASTPKSRSSKAAAATPAPAVVDAAAAGTGSVPPVVAQESGDEAASEVDSLKQRLLAAVDAVRAEKARLQEVGKTLVALVEGLVRDTNMVLRKNLRRKRRTGASNSNSGFMKAKPVTNEICEFLGRPAGTLMSRTDVTRGICEYVTAHNLQVPDNRKTFVPDQRLTTLLRLQPGQTLAYFDLQGKMNHLFIKPVPAQTA